MCHQHQFSTCSRDGDVEPAFVKHEAGATRADKGENHDVTFAALKPFDGIDRYAGSSQSLAHQNNLRAEWGNDADVFRSDAIVANVSAHEFFNSAHFGLIFPLVGAALGFNWNE